MLIISHLCCVVRSFTKTFKVHSHGTAAAAATAEFSCRNNWIPQYLMVLFTLCGSGNGCGNDAASKWVLTLYLQLWQWQTNCFNCYLPHQCEHFGSIAADKLLPLPHRVNGPLQRFSQNIKFKYHLSHVLEVFKMFFQNRLSTKKGHL